MAHITNKEFNQWIQDGKDQSFDYLLVVCDTFSYADYPVYCNTGNLSEMKAKYDDVEMQRIHEIVSLAK